MSQFNTDIKLVQLNDKDISGLIDLSASVGWDYDYHEVQTVLRSGMIFGFKNFEGKIVSSAAIIKYDSRLASIGMVIVHEDYRGLGLAKEVTQKCISSVSYDISIMLIATEEGRPLYEKLGFVVVDSVNKFICHSFHSSKLELSSGFKLEDYSEEYFDDLIKLDGGAVGDTREKFLRERIKQSNQCLVAKNKSGNVIGYGLSIRGPINLIIGPIVAPTTELALCLLQTLAFKHEGNLRIDVPSGKDKFMTVIEDMGFKQVANPPIMVKNTADIPFRNQTLFSIASQAFG